MDSSKTKTEGANFAFCIQSASTRAVEALTIVMRNKSKQKYAYFHTTPRPQNCHSDNFEALLLYLRVIGCFTDTSSSDFAE